MKLFNSSCAAILIGSALLLSACGGGGSTTQSAAPAPSFSVGGTVTGLGNASGLTLVNGTETLAVAANATAFTFVTKQSENSTYSVSVGAQPTGLTCKLSNASGAVAQADVRAVAVNCTKTPFTVSTLAGGASATLMGLQPMLRATSMQPKLSPAPFSRLRLRAWSRPWPVAAVAPLLTGSALLRASITPRTWL